MKNVYPILKFVGGYWKFSAWAIMFILLGIGFWVVDSNYVSNQNIPIIIAIFLIVAVNSFVSFYVLSEVIQLAMNLEENTQNYEIKELLEDILENMKNKTT